MNRFVARENIKHFRELLLSDIDRAERLRVQQLLVEEEDKLGKDLELLADLEKHILDGNHRIKEQRARVEAMQLNGHAGLGGAIAFLNGMMESQRITTDYHQLIVTKVQRNGLLDR